MDDFEDINSKFRRVVSERFDKLFERIAALEDTLADIAEVIENNEERQRKIDQLTADLIESNRLLEATKK